MKITIGFIIFLFLFTFLFTEGFAQVSDLPNDFGTTVYEFAGRYYVKDSHDIITSNNEPDSVIKTALARGGDIYIAGGTYNLSQYFSGFDLKSDTHLKIAPNAYIIVPSGYSGYVFRMNSDTFHCILEGGNINEASQAKRNWIGVLLEGESVSFNLVENVVVTNPFIVIDFNTTSPNYISANTFYNINGNNFVRGIEFDFSGKYIPWVSGFFGNTFRDLQFQSGSMTTYGVKDIRYYNNAFYNVIFWDLPPGSISASIDPLAVNNIIIGGDMTYSNFEDRGHNTIILDRLHTKIISNSTLFFAILNGTHNVQVNTPLPLRQVLNMSIISQPTSGIVNGVQGQLSISNGKPVLADIFGTVINPRGGSVLLTITRPDNTIEHIGAVVTSSGTFYYPMIFDRNSLVGQYQIDGTYQNSNLGSLFLNVTSYPLPSITNTNSNTDTSTSLESNSILYAQIKNDAKLWSQDKISDDVFISRIQYLAKIGIIEMPNELQNTMHQTTHIPSWLKNNAGWWADGQISNNDFISEIQYLLDNKILEI